MLIQNGKSEYRIVISCRAGKDVRYAAEQLAAYLERISGVRLPVETDALPMTMKEIIIGVPELYCELSDEAAALRNDGFILRTVRKSLHIAGCNERACVYGVYWLLEHYMGCRFFTHDFEIVPQQKNVVLPVIDETVVPPFEFRHTYWHEILKYHDFAVKRGVNAFSEPVHGIVSHSLCHTLHSYLSPEEYFDSHPEYFSMVNGVRIREQTQLCLTNPEVKRIVTENMRRTIRENPQCRIFSVSQMDWYNPCQCPECARIDAEEGSHMGTMLRFVNECADAIADEFPDVIIQTLAYQYTRRPPRLTKPRPNVSVCLCTIECCFTHPMRECRVPMRPFRHKVDPEFPIQRDLEEWGRICKRLMVWDYTTNYRFYLAPVINFHVLQDNMRYFIENGVTMLFEQGNGQSRSGEFGEMRTYLITRLMWEPEGDVSAWMDEFLDAYYGKGWRPLRRYIDLLTEYVTRHHVHAGIYENPMDVIPNTLLPEMTRLFDEAERLTEDDQRTRENVRRARLQLEFIRHHRKLRCEEDFAESAEKLIDGIRWHGITYVQERFNMTPEAGLEKSFRQIRNGTLPGGFDVFWCPTEE